MEIVIAILSAFAGIIVGTIICTILILIALPIAAAKGKFVSGANPGKPSGVHFFTGIAPGEVKIIVRKDDVVRMVTKTANKKFRRGPDKSLPEYWELDDAPGQVEDPIADVWLPIRWWARLVYRFTRLVFTGIYPIQRVYEYPLERTLIERKEDGRKEGDSNLILRVKNDLSDHLRTQQFLFPVHITGAETKDKIPLDIIGVAELETVNPYLAAFGTDRWDLAIINLITDAVTDETKTMPLDKALTADNIEEARRIANVVEKIPGDTVTVGIEICKFRVLEINPQLDAEGLRIIQSEALARQKAKGMRIEGDARADNLTAINKANQAGGEHSLATMQTEGMVRAAEAAGKGGGTVILTAGANSRDGDPTQLAILAELKKLNGGK